MQKSLNMIDMGERSCNVMISGLNENELIVENDGNEQTLTDDKGKVMQEEPAEILQEQYSSV